MSADAKPDWQDVERQGVALIDKGILLTGLGDRVGAFASFDKAVSICRPISRTRLIAALGKDKHNDKRFDRGHG